MKSHFKLTLAIAFGFIISSGTAQSLEAHYPEIEAAQDSMATAFRVYASCILTKDLDLCKGDLIKKATDDYRKYAVASLLFQVDSAATFDLHQQIYQTHPNEEAFLLEYAIELHRRGQYEQASKLYERYAAAHTSDFTPHVWLTDCYMQLGQTDKAAEQWRKADHAANHTGIDKALNMIYGRTDQLKKREAYRKEITQGKTASIYPLIVADLNWEVDPWNKVIQSDFIEPDMDLAALKLTKTSDAYKKLKAYVSAKKAALNPGAKDSIKAILKAANIILDGKPLPEYGAMTSDLLRLCIQEKLVDEKAFYQSRGEEILGKAKANKDVEMLNSYAYLQVAAQGVVNPDIDKMGWKEFHDERFAISYFIGKAERNRYDDPELAQAMADFPASSMLYWVKTNCAKIEHKPLRPLLIETIKRELKTLGSDPSHYSYMLNSYFGYLATEK